MRFSRNGPLTLDTPTGPNNRRHGRVRCEGMRCLFLEKENEEALVLDFSASGMRLRMKRVLDLETGMGQRVAVGSPAGMVETLIRVVWAKRRGFRKYDVGVTFGDPSEELRRTLAAVMRAASDTYTVYTGS